MKDPSFPLFAALGVIETCVAQLVAEPSPDDLATLVARVAPDNPKLLEFADPAWSLLQPGQQRIAWLAHCTLGDRSIARSVGPLPDDATARIAALAVRLAPTLKTPAELRDKLRQEELARQLAALFGLPIEGENPATSRFLLREMDSIAAVMAENRKAFETALDAARATIDSKHRPARPYGE